MLQTIDLSLGAGATVRAASVTSADDVPAALRALHLSPPLPALALVGGAAGLADADAARLRPLFVSGLAPAIERVGGCVVDGGTDAGVMRLMGEARAHNKARFPLVGVIASGKVARGRPDEAPDAATPEPRHSHFVLVPGSAWGDESPWLVNVAGALAGSARAITLVVGGGSITWRDVESAVDAGRPILVVAGSGGVADALAAALSGDGSDARARKLASEGRFRLVDVAAGPGALADAVTAELRAPDAKPAKAAALSGDDNALRELIAKLDLPVTKRRYLDTRWLAQIGWMEGKAKECQRKYHWSRRLTVIGSALVPALISIPNADNDLRWLVLAVSLLVSISAAWEEFFRNADRWRHYRHAAEQLKREGWLYFELSGPYASCPDHASAHCAFVTRVEEILGQDVDEFISQVTTERERPRPTGPRPAPAGARSGPAAPAQ